jgi:hypothetical protein
MKLKDTAKFLPLMQAAAQGKTIQINNGSDGREFWSDLDKEANWLFQADSDQYRIKPKESEAAKFRELWKRGKIVEFMESQSSNWQRVESLFDNIDDNNYLDRYYAFRLAKELRPWKPEEVPVGALLRSSTYHPERKVIILGVILNCGNIQRPALTFRGDCGTNDDHYYLNDLITSTLKMEHSLDHGKTWLPCGVME